MPRRLVKPDAPQTGNHAALAAKLAEGLRTQEGGGQPVIYEREYSTGLKSVTVIWDEWATVRSEDRADIILEAYDLADGKGAREKVPLATGFTVPEAEAVGLLPFRIVPAVRNDDAVTQEECDRAMLQEGGSQLYPDKAVRLLFATAGEAQAARNRLSSALPGSESVWLTVTNLSPAAWAGSVIAD